MSIEDFLYEHTEESESEFDFDFYNIYMQRDCDDPYYPPYNDIIGVYKYKENAIKSAKERFYKYAKDYVTEEERKYGGVEVVFYVDGGYFEDREDNGENNYEDNDTKKSKKRHSNKPIYIIYDKDEEAIKNARLKKMNKFY